MESYGKLSLGDWLTSVSIVSSKFIHVVLYVRTSFLFKTELYCTVGIDICLSIHPSTATGVASASCQWE